MGREPDRCVHQRVARTEDACGETCSQTTQTIRGVDYSTRDAVVNVGALICTELRDDQSVGAVISAVKVGGFSSRDTGILLGSSVGAF